MDEDVAPPQWLNDPALMGRWMEQVAEAKGLYAVFKDQADQRVAVIEGQGQRWLVKWRRVGRWSNVLSRGIRCGALWREWRNVRRLEAGGCRVSRPIALVQRGDQQMMVLRFMEGLSLYHYLQGRRGPGWRAFDIRGGEAAIAGAVGRQIGRLTARGWVNRDHKAPNILLDEACCTQNSEPVLIDPMGLRRRRGHRHVVKMMANLLRSARKARPVSARLAWRCMAAAIEADPTLTAGGTAKALARQIMAQAELGDKNGATAFCCRPRK